jgi:hypothetical protein
MKTIKQFGIWMAEEIAKVYLFEANFIEIIEQDNKFDFLIMDKQNRKSIIGIDIKSSKYKETKLLEIYSKKRQEYTENKFPVIIMYINYIDKTGFFEVINKRLTNNLIILNTTNFKAEIKKLTRKKSK